jgi:hypothetical protein
MDFLKLIKRHWFLAGTMVAIFFAEIFPELGAKEGKINLFVYYLYYTYRVLRVIQVDFSLGISAT